MFKEKETRTNNVIYELKKVAVFYESLSDVEVPIRINFERLVDMTESILIRDVHERFAVKKNEDSNDDKNNEDDKKKKN
jgi:hypothetical protein